MARIIGETSIKISPEMRPCLLGDGESKRRALLHCFGFKAWTHGAAVIIGGFPAGQESHAMAVVELESGEVLEVPVIEVTMLDTREKMDGMAWPESAGADDGKG